MSVFLTTTESVSSRAYHCWPAVIPKLMVWSVFTARPWLDIHGENNPCFHCRIMVGFGGSNLAIHIEKNITFDTQPDKDKFYIKIIVLDEIL